MDQEKFYLQKKNIVHRKESDGYSILFNPEVGNTAILDNNACFIWERCSRKVTVKDISRSIYESFESVKIDNLDDKIQTILEDLYDKSFLILSEDSNE